MLKTLSCLFAIERWLTDSHWILRDETYYSNTTQDPIAFHFLQLFSHNSQVTPEPLTLMLLVADLAKTKWCKKPGKWLKPWHKGTHLKVLSDSYQTITIMTGFRCFFKDCCSLVPLMKVASALEGLNWVLFVSDFCSSSHAYMIFTWMYCIISSFAVILNSHWSIGVRYAAILPIVHNYCMLQ